MPYDQMGSGYGRYSRGSGEYGVKSIYGYGDQGAFYNPQQAQQYRQAQQQPQPAINQSSAPQQQPTDFFSQLAGLFGGGGQMGAPQGDLADTEKAPTRMLLPARSLLNTQRRFRQRSTLTT